MNNTTCRLPLVDALGAKPSADFLRNFLAIRASRTHLLARGLHVELTALAEQVGFRIHVFLRHEAFERLKEAPSGCGHSQNDLYDVALSLREALMHAPLRGCPVAFQVGEVTLVAHFGPLDHDDPRRAITVTLTDED